MSQKTDHGRRCPDGGDGVGTACYGPRHRQQRQLDPGGFAEYTVRVPNESDTGSTIRVEVQIPDGLEASRYQPKPGWNMSIVDGVLVIDGGTIAPGEFEEFRFQARNPEKPGDLSFPAVQTYDDGEVVNWTGEAQSETPASGRRDSRPIRKRRQR